MPLARLLRLPSLLLCALLCAGADGCPLTLGTGDNGSDTSTGTSDAALDIGGPAGALWTLRYATETDVTLRTGNQVASAKARPDDGPLALLGRTLDVNGTCWRVDVACPEQVLATQTVVAQPQQDQVLLGYNRKGPLAALTQQGLWGRLAAQALSVPLGMVSTPADPCTLASGSAIYATASPAADEPGRADLMRGRVTVRYRGDCVTLGGTGGLVADDLLELSVEFSAERTR